MIERMITAGTRVNFFLEYPLFSTNYINYTVFVLGFLTENFKFAENFLSRDIVWDISPYRGEFLVLDFLSIN